jgi:hypothetical protein
MVLMVIYDLQHPVRDTDDVERVIKSFEARCHLSGSAWFIETSEEPAHLRDTFEKVAPEGLYFIQKVTSAWSAYGVSTTAIDWLQSTDRLWD